MEKDVRSVKRFDLFIPLAIIYLFASAPEVKGQTEQPIQIPRDTTFTIYQTYVKQKKYFPDIKIVYPSLPKGVVAEENLVYTVLDNTPYGKRELHLDLFRPENKKKYPAVILIHGGGWSSGDRTQEIPMAQQIAAKGYVTAAVEFRLSPEALYPAAIHDVKAAIRWMRAHADQYGIDGKHIAVLGCSSGGQMVNLIGATNGLKKYEGEGGNAKYSSRVQAVVNIDGISDFTVEESIANAQKAKEAHKTSADSKWLGGTYAEQPEIWKEASPIYWISSKSAPVCFINSAISRFHNGRDEEIKKLRSFHIYAEVHTISNTPHPFWFFHPWFNTTLFYTVAFLDKVLKGK